MSSPDPSWIEAQRVASARAMRNACSATHLLRQRAGFGWSVRPALGSVLASPRVASWDPEPDYFHHWVRDSAIVLRAVPQAIGVYPEARTFWLGFVADFTAFSLAISDPERRGSASNPLRETALPEYEKFLRPDAELAALTGEVWLEEPRFAPDGTPDMEQWSRPQDDGPALRATALMSVQDALPETRSAETEALITRDLAHVLRVAGRPCIGPWEEAPPRRCTFTLLAQWDALDRGFALTGDPAMRDAADRVAALIQTARDATGGWRESVDASESVYDSATVLALLSARRMEGPFALTASGTQATVAALEEIFEKLYPISHDHSVPAIGRFASDIYFDGNPWFPTTLGFAELHYLIAAETGNAKAFVKAEAWMRMIETVAPKPHGPLPEQFDRTTGAPRSCLYLTWSAAAFLEACAARDLALQTIAGAR